MNDLQKALDEGLDRDLELFLTAVWVQLQCVRRRPHQYLFADRKLFPDLQLQL